VEGEAVVLRRPAPSLATVHRKASSLAARHGWPEPSYAWYVPPPERLTPPCWSWPTRATRPSGAHQPLGRPSGPPAIRPAPTRDQDKLMSGQAAAVWFGAREEPSDSATALRGPRPRPLPRDVVGASTRWVEASRRGTRSCFAS
jgi:hypothetical protein